MLDVQTSQQGSSTIMAIRGKITFDVIAQLNTALQDVISAHQPKRLVINLENVTRIDSSGVGLLVASRNIMNRNMGHLHLCGICPHVMDVLKKMNLNNYFSIAATVRDALGNEEDCTLSEDIDTHGRTVQDSSSPFSAR
jgi:anti-anti-sigma factor